MIDKGEYYLKIDNLNYSINKNEIIKDFNLAIKENEFVTLLGPTGCGKSTFFKILTSYYKGYNGTIHIGSKNLNEFNGNISLMPQRDSLLPFRTVLENLQLPLEVMKLPEEEIKGLVSIYLKEFEINDYLNYYPKMLSGGTRQRVNLLRAYLMQGNLMLLDEPFNALDYIIKINLYNWVNKIFKRHKRTFIMITHDIDEALNLSDRIFVLSNKPTRVVAEFSLDNSHTDESFDFVNMNPEKLELKNKIIELFKKEY